MVESEVVITITLLMAVFGLVSNVWFYNVGRNRGKKALIRLLRRIEAGRIAADGSSTRRERTAG